MSDGSAEAISRRLADLFDERTDNEVVARLREAGHATSYETVRGYRKGLRKRVDAAFLAAVCVAFGVSADWMLWGAEDQRPARDELEARRALEEIVRIARRATDLMAVGEDERDRDARRVRASRARVDDAVRREREVRKEGARSRRGV